MSQTKHPALRREFPAGDTLAERALPDADYVDAYSVRLARAIPDAAEHYARALLTDAPAWLRAAMRLRDAAVGVVGLKTSRMMRDGTLAAEEMLGSPADRPPRIGIFKVLLRDKEELLLGDDDRHLDFRISIVHREANGASELMVVTAVKVNNLMGRLYIIPVLPLHRLIVPALMRRALWRLHADIEAAHRSAPTDRADRRSSGAPA